MFYAHFVLAKKGPLSKIWLAAHWDKKLTKAHVFETNIETSVDGILKPKVKMALRTSGHLLLGVVRIYSRKAKYLLQDCNEAFVKIKMAFRPGMVDLPEEHREAAMNAITLPEVFHDFDTAMPELNEVDIEAQFSLNQSRAEEITMREDYGSLNLVTHDDGFGDMGFDTDNPDIMRDAMGSGAGLEQSNLLFADGSSIELRGKEPDLPGTSHGVQSLIAPSHDRRMETAPHHMDDGFGGTIGDVSDDFGHAGGLFEGDLFGDVTASGSGTGAGSGMPGSAQQPQSLQAEIAAGVSGAAEAERAAAAAAAAAAADSDDDMPDHYDAADSPHHSWPGSPHPELGGDLNREPDPAELMPPPSVPRPPSVRPMDVDVLSNDIPDAMEAQTAPIEAPADDTTLLNNEEESFALAPLDATQLKGITKTKRKRKLIVDEVKNISGEEMKNQLSNTSDIVTSLDLAPPTRRLMHWKETGGVEKLFTLPARPIPSKILFKMYQRNMTQKSELEEIEARELEAARRVRSPDRDPVKQTRQTRKRKADELPPETPASVQPEIEPPTPIPQDYEPSIEPEMGPQTPAGYQTPRGEADIEPPNTPGMLSSLGPPLTPGTLGPLTPGTLLHGGLTPADQIHPAMSPSHAGMSAGLGLDGGLTPGGLGHGGLTPVGLHHGGMTPGGLDHGGMTPAGLLHGGMTPAGLHHGGMTPAGLHHGGMTPAGLHHGGMTPAGLHHGDMTPAGLHHGGLTPAGLQHGGMTPSGLQHGLMMSHGLDSNPLLRPNADPSLQSQAAHHDHGLGMEPMPLAMDYPDQSGMQMTNLGYDDGHHSPHHDYDLPPSVERTEEEEREVGETDEQFEERVLNRRAAQLFSIIRPKLAMDETIPFRDLAPSHNNRKQVAQKFYSLLVLKKHQVLKLQQEDTYGTLLITRGVQFETEAI